MPDTRKLPTSREGGASAPERWWPFENLRSEIDRVFNEFTPGFFDRSFARIPAMHTSGRLPAVDFIETDNAYELTAELPGMETKDLDVSLSNGILTIKGEKQESKEERQKEYYVSERRFGSFQRNLQLPDGVDADKIDASYANGVLKIVLPKTHGSQGTHRKIAIKAP